MNRSITLRKGQHSALRDFLETLDWDKEPPPPPLPDSVVDATRDRYVEAYERITGRRFADWPA